MYQPPELFNDLSTSEISRTLRLSGIPEKELYTEDDADRFRECRTLIEQGGTDEDVMALLSPVVDVVLSETQDNSLPEIKNGRKKSGKKATKSLDITELLSLAREQGFKLTLTTALKIFADCGLKEQDEYTLEESERFLAACNLRHQGKTEIEIAANFGAGVLDAADIELSLEETERLIQDSGDLLFGEMLREKAGQHAAIAPGLYLKYLAQELASESSQQNWRSLLEMIKARAVGKPQPQFTLKVQTLQLQQPLNSLPPNSENGSTSD
ncbi:hypothetical protein GTQ43_39315 [Nostoc sp. KVJ3]|uniref:hypothetical protein n=1 Tax=Nostoc sp. KVJ3 TaxID=457945 RepID=UPI002238F1FC|nr:hypothetical protein [Nostoc sp. KVJ3]MCW5319399.1 hypothetical protein [Nostoc sp. KVJ3]